MIARSCVPAAIALAVVVAMSDFGAPAQAADPAAPATAWPLKPHAVKGLTGTPALADLPADLPGATSASGARCRNYYFPVTESASSTTVYREFGQLCTMDPAKLGTQPIQVLIHGGTYNHIYYDWPYKPDRYNYARYMTRRGFTTLNLDRLGYGFSDHPPSVTLNFDVAAYNTHQIVQYLRRGALGRRFGTVVLNGYSMGGLTAEVEDARYHDVNALAVHAVGHGVLTPRSTLLLATLFYPALIDPKFSSQPWALDPGYLTSIPGQRTAFYGPPSTYDPAQLTYEEEYKDTVTATEVADITLKSYTDLTRDITAPILWTPGEYDKIWCGTTENCYTDPETKNEPSYYRPGVFTEYVVPDTGHAVLLGYGGVDYLAEVFKWLGDHGIRGVP